MVVALMVAFENLQKHPDTSISENILYAISTLFKPNLLILWLIYKVV